MMESVGQVLRFSSVLFTVALALPVTATGATYDPYCPPRYVAPAGESFKLLVPKSNRDLAIAVQFADTVSVPRDVLSQQSEAGATAWRARLAPDLFGAGSTIELRASPDPTDTDPAKVVLIRDDAWFTHSFRDGPLHAAPDIDNQRTYIIPEGAVPEGGAAGFWRLKELFLQLEPGERLPVRLTRPVALNVSAPAVGASARARIEPVTRAPEGRNIRVTLKGSGVQFGELSVLFCFKLDGNNNWVRADSVTPAAETVGEASYNVVIPKLEDKSRRWRSEPIRMRALGYRAGKLELDVDQPYRVSSKTWGLIFALATALFAILLPRFLSGKRTGGAVGFSEVFRGRAGKTSLSMFQTWSWSVLVLSALIYVWAVSGVLLEIPPQILGLLGISATSSVLARAAATNMPAPTATSPQAATVMPAAVKPSFNGYDLISDEQGFNLLRFQMLAFTLFTFFYVIIGLWATHAFPDIPESLLILMGVSNAAYLGGKVVDRPKADVTVTDSTTTVAWSMTPERIVELQRAVDLPETGVLDDATRAAVSAFQVKRGLGPVDGTVGRDLWERIVQADGNDRGVDQPAATPDDMNVEDGVSADELRIIQVKLGVPQTGALDAPTTEAIRRVETANGLPVTGRITSQLLAVLDQ